jgi:acetyltransferase-like isoleucine patch superfamily enzyme
VILLQRLARYLHRKTRASNTSRSIGENIKIGVGVYLPPNSILDARKISIGDYTRVNGKINIHGSGEAIIGKYCAIGRDVLIITSNHIVSRASLQLMLYLKMFKYKNIVTKGPVEIGNDVWIGDRTILVSGAKVRDGCVIGAGSVVTKEIRPYSIAAGSPARVIRSRFPRKIVQQLLEIKWWDWPRDRIKRNREFFLADLTDPELDLATLVKE